MTGPWFTTTAPHAIVKRSGDAPFRIPAGREFTARIIDPQRFAGSYRIEIEGYGTTSLRGTSIPADALPKEDS